MSASQNNSSPLPLTDHSRRGCSFCCIMRCSALGGLIGFFLSSSWAVPLQLHKLHSNQLSILTTKEKVFTLGREYGSHTLGGMLGIGLGFGLYGYLSSKYDIMNGFPSNKLGKKSELLTMSPAGAIGGAVASLIGSVYSTTLREPTFQYPLLIKQLKWTLPIYTLLGTTLLPGIIFNLVINKPWGIVCL